MLDHLKQQDAEVFDAVKKELGRQHTQLEMIASENHVSRAILDTVGTVLTNKYAEGYPGKRYYGGGEVVDLSEKKPRDRAQKNFCAPGGHAQPHFGSPAEMAGGFHLP